MYFFLSRSCVDREILHSFPTRRSSDLVGEDLEPGYVVPGALDSRVAPAVAEAVEKSALRSEEHTSELQSRGQLVCRLLLEKKNCAQPAPGEFIFAAILICQPASDTADA